MIPHSKINPRFYESGDISIRFDFIRLNGETMIEFEIDCSKENTNYYLYNKKQS